MGELALQLGTSRSTTSLAAQEKKLTRRAVKRFVKRYQIEPLVNVTKLFGGLPCRTVKIFPFQEDFDVEEFFATIPGYIVATLFTENDRKEMFVSFSVQISVEYALKKSGTISGECPVQVEVLSDLEFLYFLKDLMYEFNYSLEEVRKKDLSFQVPDARGTILSEELDKYLCSVMLTLRREKKKAEDEENLMLASIAKRMESKNLCPDHRRRNNFEKAYAQKEVGEFDMADHLPKCIMPNPNRVKRLMEMRKKSREPPARHRGLKLAALLAAASAGCFIAHQVASKAGGAPTNLLQCLG